MKINGFIAMFINGGVSNWCGMVDSLNTTKGSWNVNLLTELFNCESMARIRKMF